MSNYNPLNTSSEKSRLSYDTIDKKILVNNQTISELVGGKKGNVDSYNAVTRTGIATIDNKSYPFTALNFLTIAVNDAGIFIRLTNFTKTHILIGVL